MQFLELFTPWQQPVLLFINLCRPSNKHRAAVLGLHMPSPDLLVSACQDRHVRLLDLRLPVSVAGQHKTHKRSVLCVAASHNYVYSGGEDKSVCVWDIRKQAVLDQVTVSLPSWIGACVCVCVSLLGNVLCWNLKEIQ